MDQGLSAEPRIGEGVIPERLNRLNVGAFLLAPLWALMHGIWPWFFAFLGVVGFNVVGWFAVSGLLGGSLVARILWQVVGQGLGLALSGTFAFRANRLVWEEEHRRIYSQPSPQAPDLVTKFERDQRNWLIGGFVLVAYVGIAPFLITGLGDPYLIGSQLGYAAVELIAVGVLYVWDRSGRPRTART